MSKSKGEALYIYQQENGVLLARAAHFNTPVRVTELLSIPTHEIHGNPLVSLSSIENGKKGKGFREAHIVISSDKFRHFFHEPESISKNKSADYIPTVVKEWLGNDKDDYFFQVLTWENGEIVAIEEPTQKLMLISGIKTKKLGELQAEILSSDFYPRKLECSVVLMLGLLRKMIATAKLKAPVIFLEIYEDSGLLAILPADGKPLLRTIDSGEKAMYQQIKNELSLKDTTSAQKLMFSSTIDLSDIGRQVINPIFKEIASIVGLFEVETGQSISQLMVSNLMPNQHWVAELLAKDLGMGLLEFNLKELAQMVDVQFEDGVEWNMRDNRILPLLAAMGVL